jgi:predicted DNA-binding transcriptional regulator AlpA
MSSPSSDIDPYEDYRYVEVPDVVNMTGLSKTRIEEMIRRKEIPYTPFGRRKYFRLGPLKRWLDEQEIWPDAV